MFYKDKKWQRNWFFAFFSYSRDFFINLIPVKKLPPSFLKSTYGFTPDFVFLVHPRRSQDFFIALPFLTILRRVIPKKIFLYIISKFPPFVLAKIKTPIGINGLVVSSLYMPELLFRKRRATLIETRKLTRFAARISRAGSCIGLGGWLPMVTRRGEYLEKYAKGRDSFITSGHTVTVLSIISTIDKICKISGLSPSRLKVVILGAGKIGSKIAQILIGADIGEVSLVDTNTKKLLLLQEKLGKNNGFTHVNFFTHPVESNKVKAILSCHHIGVCAVSGLGGVFNDNDIPDNFIIIDDSRPEGVSRDVSSDSKIILEGGLMKIPGLTSDYDYGMGIDDNVFGCLAEAFILSIEKNGSLRPTIGDVDLNNFLNVKDFCDKSKIVPGDFKSKELTIGEEKVRRAILARDAQIG